MHAGKKVCSQKNLQFMISLYLIKCLKNVKQQRLLLACAPIPELPSNISTMSQPLTVLFFVISIRGGTEDAFIKHKCI